MSIDSVFLFSQKIIICYYYYSYCNSFVIGLTLYHNISFREWNCICFCGKKRSFWENCMNKDNCNETWNGVMPFIKPDLVAPHGTSLNEFFVVITSLSLNSQEPGPNSDWSAKWTGQLDHSYHRYFHGIVHKLLNTWRWRKSRTMLSSMQSIQTALKTYGRTCRDQRNIHTRFHRKTSRWAVTC